MTVTPSSIKTIAPEFEDVDDATIQIWIDAVVRRTNEDAWGEIADDGVTYLVLHWLTVRAQQQDAGAGGAQVRGPLTSVTVGPLSRSYANPAAAATGAPYSDAWFALSSWGLMYVELRETVFADRIGELC